MYFALICTLKFNSSTWTAATFFNDRRLPCVFSIQYAWHGPRIWRAREGRRPIASCVTIGIKQSTHVGQATDCQSTAGNN